VIGYNLTSQLNGEFNTAFNVTTPNTNNSQLSNSIGYGTATDALNYFIIMSEKTHTTPACTPQLQNKL